MEDYSVEEVPNLTEEEKEHVRHNAWSIENKAAWPDAGTDEIFLFEREASDGRISQYYADENGNYWFRNVWRRPDGRIISEDEHIFGQKRQKKNRYK